jgi:hypothetical protein
MYSVRIPRRAHLALLLVAIGGLPAAAAGQVPDEGAGVVGDPAPPTGDAPINQAGQRGATLRAYRVDEPLDIDGVLDEAFYTRIRPISEFVQGIPVEDGEPTERTEAWNGFDDDYVYDAAKIYDSAGPDGWVAN